MEKYRFYCELPGDIWEDGYFMQLIKMNQVCHGAARCAHASSTAVRLTTQNPSLPLITKPEPRSDLTA